MKAFLALLLTTIAASAQTGEVVIDGTVMSGGTAITGFENTKAFDGNYETSFAVTSNGAGWVGMDAGAAVTLTRLRLAGRDGDTATFWGQYLPGVVLEGSNDSGFSPATTIYTVPALNASNGLIFPPNELTEKAVAPGTAYRYYRLRDPNSRGNIAEMRLLASAFATNARPVAPVLSPGSGGWPRTSVTVSMSSLTTSASIRYTIDGSTPSCSSTLYSAPVAVTINTSTTVTIKAVACDSNLTNQTSEIASGEYNGWVWRAGTKERDDVGGIIQTVSPHIFYGEGYYWMVASKSMWGSDIPQWPNQIIGVWMWKSADLYSWTRVGLIIPPQGTKVVTGRVHVIYNVSTAKWVLWGNVCDSFLSTQYALIATADHPQGPWTVLDSQYLPGGFVYKDNNLFVDDDGTGYAVFTSTSNQIQYIYQLNSSYTAVVGSPTTVSNEGREAPVMLKRGSTYFIITTRGVSQEDTTENDIRVQTASSPLGTWSAVSWKIESRDTTNTAWRGQSANVFQPYGMRDAYLYIGDHWVSTHVAGPGSTEWYTFTLDRRVYLPLTFPTSTEVSIPVVQDAPEPFNLNYWRGGLFPMPGNVHIRK